MPKFFQVKSTPRVDTTALACLALATVVFCLYDVDISTWPGATIHEHTQKSYEVFRKGTDMSDYCRNAQLILAGEWPKEPFFRAPLYSYLLATLAWFSQRVWVIVAAQTAMAIATVTLIHATAKSLFDRATATVSSAMTILYGGYVFWIAIPHSAITEVFLSALSLRLVITLRNRFNPAHAIWAGAACGLLCLVRPNFLVVAPPVLAAVAGERAFRSKHYRQALIPLIVATLAFAAFTLPPVIWNNISSDKLILSPNTNGDIGYKNSNSQDSLVYGYHQAQKPLMPVASVAFWSHQIAKTLAFCKSVEYPQNENFYVFRRFSNILPLLFVNFGLILGLYAAGATLFCGRFSKYWPLYVWPMAYAVTIIIFHIIGRYRLPAIPAMIPLAAAFVVTTTRLLTRKRRRAVIPKALKTKTSVALVVFAITLLHSEPWTQVDKPLYWRNLATLYFRDLNLQGYINCLEHLLRQRPEPSDFLNHATATALTGRFDDAKRELGKMKEFLPRKDYLDHTIVEIDLLKAMNDDEIAVDKWRVHLKEGKIGHVIRLQASIDDVIAMRKRFNLPVPDETSP